MRYFLCPGGFFAFVIATNTFWHQVKMIFIAVDAIIITILIILQVDRGQPHTKKPFQPSSDAEVSFFLFSCKLLVKHP